MKKNSFKFMFSELIHEQFSSLSVLSCEIADLSTLFLFLNIFLMQNLFLICLIWTSFMYKFLNYIVCHSFKSFLLLIWLLLTWLQLAWLLAELLAWLLANWLISHLLCSWLIMWVSCLYLLISYHFNCVVYVNLIFFT